MAAPCPGQNHMDLCCLANNFNKKLLIGDRAVGPRARSPPSAPPPPPNSSRARSLMSSTAGFTGANVFNKGLVRGV